MLLQLDTVLKKGKGSVNTFSHSLTKLPEMMMILMRSLKHLEFARFDNLGLSNTLAHCELSSTWHRLVEKHHLQRIFILLSNHIRVDVSISWTRGLLWADIGSDHFFDDDIKAAIKDVKKTKSDLMTLTSWKPLKYSKHSYHSGGGWGVRDLLLW